jgi:phosphomevalonate kinase
MTAVHASAPGKLFLLGEYAVLDGAPALLTAVDRRVAVSITDSDDAHWHLSTPGLHTDEIVLDARAELLPGHDAQSRERVRVFDAVRRLVPSEKPLSISIDSTAFFASKNKLGLGSSAAVATALAAALAATTGLSLSQEQIRILATKAHRAAQDDTGSGGDVAASSFGGLISYTRDSAPTPLSWPEELTIMVVVTGAGSSTSDLIATVADYARREESHYHEDIGRLTTLARQAEGALRSPHAFLDLADDYYDALVTLDEHSAAGIVSTFHRRLHSLAAGFGGVFKTSGAGGGDVGLAFVPTGAAVDKLGAAFALAGAQAVPLAFGARGVDVTINAAREATDNGNTESGSVTVP